MQKSSKRPRTKAKHAKPLQLWIHGSTGRMGQEIQEALKLETKKFVFAGGSSRTLPGESSPPAAKQLADLLEDVDIVVDFSSPEGGAFLWSALASAKLKGKAIVVGTTGLGHEHTKKWADQSKKMGFRTLFAPNTSLGIIATLQAAKLVEKLTHGTGFDIEIVETHHRRKKDSPSGTARFLAENIADQAGASLEINRRGERKDDEIGIVSVRGGGVFGEHEIRFIAEDEEIDISHRAFRRSLFAKGALLLASWLVKQEPGVYGLRDVDFGTTEA